MTTPGPEQGSWSAPDSAAQPVPPPAAPAAPAAPPAYGVAPAYGAAPTAPGGYLPPPVPGLPSGVTLASWGARVGGYLIDMVLALIVELIFRAISPGLGFLSGLLIWYGLYPYLESTSGQTPGKRAVGLSLRLEADGQFPSFGLAIARKIAHILDALPLLLGFLWPLWDAKKQTFADKIASTVVIRDQH